MKIGVVYPQIELDGNPESLDQIGRATEALGYDHFVMYDHVVGAVHENRSPPLWEHGPYTDKHPFHDPLIVFGYLAGITKRIELVSGVLILPQRQTVLVAKQATDIDLLSGGRLRLGVGSGWNYVEYDALGEDFAERGPRLTEQIGYLRQLWAEPLVTFNGKYDSLDRAAIIPRPRRQIPIWCGGFAERSFKRAAKLADGYIFAGGAEMSRNGLRRMHHHLQQEGRSTEGFGFECLLQSPTVGGLSVQESVDAARRWQDLGGTHASVVTMALGYTTTQQHLDHIAEFRHKLGSS